MLTILGSGFGLYGYLPALVGCCGERVLLPMRVRARFDTRAELQQFAHGVEWVADDDAALARASGAVLALPPDAQPVRALDCLNHRNISWLVLEKPLAANPAAARSLLARLEAAGVRFRIGYLFRHTAWGERLLAGWPGWSPSDVVSIRWAFMAHHFRNDIDTWKRHTERGGGALRFFGIHLVALLAELGYDDVCESSGCGATGELQRWDARFSGPGLPDCALRVDTRSNADRFTIFRRCAAGAEDLIADLKGPFDACTPPPDLPGVDSRVPLLAELCRSVQANGRTRWYADAVTLWERAEARMAVPDQPTRRPTDR
jgi:hypothetical protein